MKRVENLRKEALVDHHELFCTLFVWAKELRSKRHAALQLSFSAHF
jgi:hypothetical protein